jgi:hypothetical protein
MIVLAGIEGNLIFLIVAAAVGAINWWLEKKKKGSQSDSAKPPAPSSRTNAPAAGGMSEEQERLRRFLEALGVPQGQQPQKPQPTPQPVRQQPAQTSQPRPVLQTRERRMQTPQPVAKPVARVVRTKRPPIAPQPQEFAEAGRLEEPASAIERISSEFEAMNVHVAMSPLETPGTPAHLSTKNAGTTSVLERSGNPLVASLRRTLTNPTDIRAAFLAAELLGPPRGLQK